MAHEKRKFRHSKVGRIDASYGESTEFTRFLYRPKRGRDNHVFEVGNPDNSTTDSRHYFVGFQWDEVGH